jgi:hypothetical protein
MGLDGFHCVNSGITLTSILHWEKVPLSITASDQVAASDIQTWLDKRQLILSSVQQHLLRMQQRMKSQADKRHSKRVFSVGDSIFLKLQPYIQ